MRVKKVVASLNGAQILLRNGSTVVLEADGRAVKVGPDGKEVPLAYSRDIVCLVSALIGSYECKECNPFRRYTIDDPENCLCWSGSRVVTLLRKNRPVESWEVCPRHRLWLEYHARTAGTGLQVQG
jgi:hypothetical protein